MQMVLQYQDNPGSIMDTAKAQVVADANQAGDPDWQYIVYTVGNGKAKVSVWDGKHFLGYL